MSDDPSDRTRETNVTVRFDPEEEGLMDFPDFPDDDEFIATQEMDGMTREGHRTDPSHAALDATQRYDVPDDLLQMAMRSQEMSIRDEPEDSEPEVQWREFVAVVDPRGRIVLPSRVQQDLMGKKLRVKYIVES